MKNTLMYSGRDLMAFSPFRKLVTQVIFKLADWLGFWRYPADFDIENYRSFWRMTNWFYIAGRPIVRAERGSGLESFFKQQQGYQQILPKDFEKDITLELSAVGDLMCNSALDNSAECYYEKVMDLIFQADVSFANLESTLTSGKIEKPSISPDELPKINASLSQYDILKGYQGRCYTVVQTANNHIMDRGWEGILTTHQQLASDGIAYVGTNLSAEEQKRGLILEVNGMRLGFVAATYGVNGRPFPDGKSYLVNIVRFHQHQGEVDLSLLEQQINWCKQQGCDLIIAGLHWGVEWEFFPRVYQIEQAHRLAESGADVIIGHHAHVSQPTEWYRTRRDPDRVVPIFYGLGNLVSLITAPYSALSLVARLRLAKGKIHGIEKTFVEKASLTPLLQLNEERNGMSYIWLDILKNLNQSATSGQIKNSIVEASRYADIAVGEGWRS